MAVRFAYREVWPTMPALAVSTELSSVLGSAIADSAAKALGGSKEASSGAVGVGEADWPPSSGPESDALSSPPLQPASRTTAAVTVINGRNIVSLSPD